jgi:hypothetical protein
MTSSIHHRPDVFHRDTRRFALETHVDEIATTMRELLIRAVGA